MCMTDGDETSYLFLSSLPPSSSSILGCCGNCRVDLRSLSPIVPLKLLNFSAHMTVSQGLVSACKENPCVQAHPYLQGRIHVYIKTYALTHPHTLTVSGEESAIYLVS